MRIDVDNDQQLFIGAANAVDVADYTGSTQRTEITSYSLRHTAITRMLLANVPIRLVARLHDTSVPMIEATYSASISSHGASAVSNTPSVKSSTAMTRRASPPRTTTLAPSAARHEIQSAAG